MSCTKYKPIPETSKTELVQHWAYVLKIKFIGPKTVSEDTIKIDISIDRIGSEHIFSTQVLVFLVVLSHKIGLKTARILTLLFDVCKKKKKK